MMLDLKSVIANRATYASGTKFFKSYVKNIKVADRRANGCNCFNMETDYFFTYKGVRYRVNQHRKGGIYSADFRYTLEVVGGIQ